MASFIARSAPQRPASICEACLKHLAAPRNRTPHSIRFFSAATHITSTRTAGGKRPLHQPSKAARGLNGTSTRFRGCSTTQRPPHASSQSSILPATARAHLPHRRLITLSGPDAPKFLQGLITANVTPSLCTPFYAAFLDARGRMLWDVFIWTYPGLTQKEWAQGEWACYVEVDAGECEALVRHLRRHKLRSKVRIGVEEGVGVWAAWGEGGRVWDGKAEIVMDDTRFLSDGVMARRALVNSNSTPEAAEEEKSFGMKVSAENYRLLRYMHGVSEGPEEIPRETALPMEYNVDLARGIDFKKGCYVGQELTIRTKHTGVVRKRILPVQLYDPSSPPCTSSQLPTVDLDWKTVVDGADIKQLDDEGGIMKGRAAGKIVKTIGNVGLALCRLEMMTSMRISGEGGTWKPGMRFGVQDEKTGEVVGVRPFVRDAFVTRERDLWDKNRTRI